MLQPQEDFNNRNTIMASSTRSVIRLFFHGKCIEKCDLWLHSVIVKKTDFFFYLFTYLKSTFLFTVPSDCGYKPATG